jgi:hypothetical protein
VGGGGGGGGEGRGGGEPPPPPPATLRSLPRLPPTGAAPSSDSKLPRSGDAVRPSEARSFSCQGTPPELLAAGLWGSARQASSDTDHVSEAAPLLVVGPPSDLPRTCRCCKHALRSLNNCPPLARAICNSTPRQATGGLKARGALPDVDMRPLRWNHRGSASSEGPGDSTSNETLRPLALLAVAHSHDASRFCRIEADDRSRVRSPAVVIWRSLSPKGSSARRPHPSTAAATVRGCEKGSSRRFRNTGHWQPSRSLPFLVRTWMPFIRFWLRCASRASWMPLR